MNALLLPTLASDKARDFIPVGAWLSTSAGRDRADRGVVGVGLQHAITGQPFYLELSVEQAHVLAGSLLALPLQRATGAQSSIESGSPSVAVSAPDECENVCPPTRSSSAACGEA